jgi:hypothetical protein
LDSAAAFEEPIRGLRLSPRITEESWGFGEVNPGQHMECIRAREGYDYPARMRRVGACRAFSVEDVISPFRCGSRMVAKIGGTGDIVEVLLPRFVPAG